MEEHNNLQNASQFGQQQPGSAGQQQFTLEPVPHSSTVLVLGIISIATCWCTGLPGIVMGIIALVLFSKGNIIYKEQPGKYSPGSYGNLKAGKVCAIIGLVLSSLYFIYFIFYVLIFSAVFSSGFMNIFDNFNSFNY